MPNQTPAPKNSNSRWTRDEMILALDLYCRTEFGKIYATQPAIQELAELMQRTPAAVAMRMCNYAAFDPAQKARGIKGLAHGGLAAEKFYNEIAHDWSRLPIEAAAARERLLHQRGFQPDAPPDVDGRGSTYTREVKARIGQDFFRAAVLSAYDRQCCITGVSDSRLLIASHIKPWSQCEEEKDRVNPQNGFCLNALHDRAFDQGLMTITKEGRIILSGSMKEMQMDDDTRNWLMSYSNQFIKPPARFEPDPEFIEYHNDVVFLGNAL